MPADPVFAPPVSVRVYDSLFGGLREPLVGVATIRLDDYLSNLPPPIQRPDGADATGDSVYGSYGVQWGQNSRGGVAEGFHLAFAATAEQADNTAQAVQDIKHVTVSATQAVVNSVFSVSKVVAAESLNATGQAVKVSADLLAKTGEAVGLGGEVTHSVSMEDMKPMSAEEREILVRMSQHMVSQPPKYLEVLEALRGISRDNPGEPRHKLILEQSRRVRAASASVSSDASERASRSEAGSPRWGALEQSPLSPARASLLEVAQAGLGVWDQEMLQLLVAIEGARAEAEEALHRIKLLNAPAKASDRSDRGAPVPDDDAVADDESENEDEDADLRELYEALETGAIVKAVGELRGFRSKPPDRKAKERRRDGGLRGSEGFFTEMERIISLDPQDELTAVLDYPAPSNQFLQHLLPRQLKRETPPARYADLKARERVTQPYTQPPTIPAVLSLWYHSQLVRACGNLLPKLFVTSHWPMPPLFHVAVQARTSEIVHQLPIAYKDYRDRTIERLRPGGQKASPAEEKAVAEKLQRVEDLVEELEAGCERLKLLSLQLSLTRQERAIRERKEHEKELAQEAAKAAAAQSQTTATSTRSKSTRAQQQSASGAPAAAGVVKQPTGLALLMRATSDVNVQFAKARLTVVLIEAPPNRLFLL